VAAGIVAVAQMGSSSVAVPAVATHAGSAAVGIAPWRRAASRRRGVAGITRSESSAIELLGLAPLLVPGGAQNFKVTYPEDFQLAQAILQARARTVLEKPDHDYP
jgi:hypothetical protein